MVIGVDFDNTICVDEWPEIGEPIPGAIETLKELKERGHTIILYTQRNDGYYIYCSELVEYRDNHGNKSDTTVDLLSPVLEFLSKKGLVFDYVNENPIWESEKHDHGRKVYFDVLIDDHNAGIKRKMIKNSKGDWCETVDWKALRDWLVSEGIL